MNNQPKHLEHLEALAERAKYEKIDLFSELKEVFKPTTKALDERSTHTNSKRLVKG
jgi:hypothetical protein